MTKYRVAWGDGQFTPNYGSWQAAFGSNPAADVYIWAFPMSAPAKPNTVLLSLEEARAFVVRQGKTAFSPYIKKVRGLHLGDSRIDFSEPVIFD